jgi:hypothetical protein
MPARGEAPRRDAQEVETIVATADPESPASTEHLMEAICDPDKLEAAFFLIDGAALLHVVMVLRLGFRTIAPEHRVVLHLLG